MNLILLEPAEASAATVALSGRRARHIIEVLRAAPGDSLRVGQLNGPLGRAEVHSVEADQVVLHCQWQSTPPPRPRLHLVLALPRPKVMQRLWSTIAQLGVERLYLTNAFRVERCYFDSKALQPERMRSGLLEGLEQAVDTWLPEVSIHKRLTHLLEDDLPPVGIPRLFADPPAVDALESVAQRVVRPPGGQLLVAIGPEGGWNDHERALFGTHGFEAFHVGRRIYRTDTALVAILSRLQALTASDD